MRHKACARFLEGFYAMDASGHFSHAVQIRRTVGRPVESSRNAVAGKAVCAPYSSALVQTIRADQNEGGLI